VEVRDIVGEETNPVENIGCQRSKPRISTWNL